MSNTYIELSITSDCVVFTRERITTTSLVVLSGLTGVNSTSLSPDPIATLGCPSVE